MLPLLLAGASAGVPVSLLAVDKITIETAQVRLSDIADLSALSTFDQAAMGAQVVATLANDRNEVEVTSEALKSWARRKFPLLRFQSGPQTKIIISYGPNQANIGSVKEGSTTCSQLTSPADFGEILLQKNITPIACDDTLGKAAIYYDRKDSVVRAAENLSAGAYLGRTRFPDDKFTDRGKEMVFVTFDGPVRVERNVRAMQAAKEGEKFFVTASDGSVFTTQYRSAEELE